MDDLETHLATFAGDNDYKKRLYDQSKMSDSIQKGKKLVDDLSSELGTNK